MNSSQFALISRRLAALIDHEAHETDLHDEYQNSVDYGTNYASFLEGIGQYASRIHLGLLQNSLPASTIEEHLEAHEYPLLVFARPEKRLQPAILYYDRNAHRLRAFLYGEEELTVDPYSLLSCLQLEEDGTTLIGVPISLTPMVSDPEGKQATDPVSRLFRLLHAERKDIFYVYFYAIVAALVGLILPLGVQSVMEMISGGVVFNTIYLMIALVVVMTLVAGGLQVMQYHIVEILQRRIFVKASYEFTQRLTRLRLEAVQHVHVPEMMNRFFDVLTIQKSLPKLLMDLTSAVLQILFGLILLSLYHPFFIFFGVFLSLVLALLFYFTGPAGLKAKMVESKYKYKVVHWLEEVSRSLVAFKSAGTTSLPLHKTEQLVDNYLTYRKKQFKVLMSQFKSIIFFKTLLTGGLLTIGTVLVVDRQITLGQFVATEIMIVLVLAAVEKIIVTLDSVYDALTAVSKIGDVTDLELERQGGLQLEGDRQRGMHVRLRNLSYQYPNHQAYALREVDLEIAPGERICLAGYNGSGKNTLGMLMLGMMEDYQGAISFDNISLRDIDLLSLRDQTAIAGTENELFEGSILDNLRMGRQNVRMEDLMWAMEAVGLTDFINEQPEGLRTELITSAKGFSHSIAAQMELARTIAERPRLLVVKDLYFQIEPKRREQIMRFLTDKAQPWTLVCISNDPHLMKQVDRVVVFKQGSVLCQGTFQELLSRDVFRQTLLPQDYKA